MHTNCHKKYLGYFNSAAFSLLALFALAPATVQADTQFQIRRMSRSDVPLGKGQCDIRLRVDGEVEVSVRQERVDLRTLSGREARDDGSECNEPLPTRVIEGFNFEKLDSRGDMQLLTPPVPPNRI